MSDRWEKHHKNLSDRDTAIINDYKEGFGILDLMKKFDIAGYQTIVNVIRAEEIRTKTSIMRPRGTNVRRWALHHEALKERDQAMVDLYLDGHSIQWLSDNFNVAWQTAQKVLKRAEEKSGKKIIRHAGVNVRWLFREEGNEVAS